MKVRILRVLIFSGIIAIGLVYGLFKLPDANSTVRAFGDLTVNFHVAPLTPIFVVTNMKPGDVESRNIDVHNGGLVTRMVSVKGIRTDGIGDDPKLETVLDLVVTDGATTLYRDKLSQFFADSLNTNGVPLNTINSGGDKTYNFKVTFPDSSGNDFQNKSVIFDLTFGEIVSRSLVINEVYYFGEWVELFNPTDHDISLKNWTLADNSGQISIIHANKIIKAGGFAILAKSASTFTKWSIPANTLKVELGDQIGDGLDNAGDHLILKNNLGAEVDRMSWGTDTSGFAPPAINPAVPLGSSTERLVPGLDTDIVSDWHSQNPPDPGS